MLSTASSVDTTTYRDSSSTTRFTTSSRTSVAKAKGDDGYPCDRISRGRHMVQRRITVGIVVLASLCGNGTQHLHTICTPGASEGLVR